MRKFEYQLQVFLLSVYAFTALMGFIGNGIFFIMLIWQLVVGIIQYISSTVHLIKDRTRHPLLKSHWIISTMFLISIFTSAWWLPQDFKDLAFLTMEILAGALAILYGTFTYTKIQTS